MVEVLGFLILGGLFTSHVTGNIVVIAALLARGGSPTAPQVLALPTFVAALVVIWHFARALPIACQFAAMRLVVPGAASTAVMTGNLTNAVLSFLQLLE